MLRLRFGMMMTCLCALVLAACSSVTTTTNTTTTPTSNGYSTSDICPSGLGSDTNCYTPHALRVAYGVQPLIQQGYTGKGQTIVDIVSYGSPTLAADMAVFDKQFGLPPVNLQIIAPLGATPTDNPSSDDLGGWRGETEGDVQVMHAIAPDAKIVVLTSPVNETEGVTGLPEFLQLEQYAADHHLGQIVSQSWGASEYSLSDASGQAIIKQFDSFYQQSTTQNKITFVSASGDAGATDYPDATAAKNGGPLVSQRTIGFPNDDPWVTVVGGTNLQRSGAGYNETVWDGYETGSGGAGGGGVSAYTAEPDYQQNLPQAIQTQLNGHRGEPDVAGVADPATSLAYYFGSWQKGGGTSFSAPIWAGIVAIANQKAGHPLGFINPALYKLGAGSTQAQDFRDITVGDNNVVGASDVTGFKAATGYDLATGWGVPLADHLVPDLIAAVG